MSTEIATEKIENAKQAMSETHGSWESRCHAIMAALGVDYGRLDQFLPDEDREATQSQKVKIEVCKGAAGLALYVNDRRVAGARHNGAMTTVLEATIDPQVQP